MPYNCAKINFIYGANGSGKTTIGNYLSNLDDSAYSDCEIFFDGDESDIIVYNRKFRESQILMGDIPGVFTLGKATKETIEEIAALKREREKAQNEDKETGVVLAEKEKKRFIDKNLVKDELWNRIYIKYKDRISFVFDGVRASKDKFYEKIMNVYRLQGGVAHDIEKLCRSAKTVISEDVLEEKMMCRSLLYWVNDGSHSISDDFYVDDNPDMICQYKEVFRKMFIQMGHEAHYNMMMKINS